MLGIEWSFYYGSREAAMLRIDGVQIVSIDDSPTQTVIVAITRQLLCRLIHNPDQPYSVSKVSVCPCQLQSLIRLSEAHAGMRVRNVVTADDWRKARRLQRETIKHAAMHPVTGTININIPTTAMLFLSFVAQNLVVIFLTRIFSISEK
nr:DNA replication licensing factor MCM4 [Hymenolepis microstoma]